MSHFGWFYLGVVVGVVFGTLFVTLGAIYLERWSRR